MDRLAASLVYGQLLANFATIELGRFAYKKQAPKARSRDVKSLFLNQLNRVIVPLRRAGFDEIWIR